MTLQAALSAPVLIRPDAGACYRLDGEQYGLMNGDEQHPMAFLANSGTGPAVVIGSIAGAGWLMVEPGDAYAIGWDTAHTAWRVLRMVEARVLGPDGLLPEVLFPATPVPGSESASSDVHPQIALTLADAAFVVEAVDGTTARVPLQVITEYLAGRLPTLAQLQTSSIWGAQK